MVDESLEEKIEKCKIPGILETKEDAQEIYFDIVRIGKKVSRDSVVTWIIYKQFEMPYSTEVSLERFKKNKMVLTDPKGLLEIFRDSPALLPWTKRFKDKKELPISIVNLLKGNLVDTSELFVDLNGNELYGLYENVNNILTSWAFGDGVVAELNYAQSKINLTERQRVGGEELKDAYAFVHTARIVGILDAYGATPYQKKLAAFHDLPEEMRDWRIEKRDKATGKQKKHLQKAITNPPEFEQIYNLYFREESHLKEVLLPIYWSIEGKIPQWLDKAINRIYQFTYSSEPLDKNDARLLQYHVRLLTRKIRESYADYVDRMVNGSLTPYVQRKVESIAPDDLEKQAQLYAAHWVAKGGDCIDNTNRLTESDVTQKRKRLDHNLDFLRGIAAFVEASPLPVPKILTDMAKELFEKTQTGIETYQKQFSSEEYGPAQEFAQKFRTLKEKSRTFFGQGTMLLL